MQSWWGMPLSPLGGFSSRFRRGRVGTIRFGPHRAFGPSFDDRAPAPDGYSPARRESWPKAGARFSTRRTAAWQSGLGSIWSSRPTDYGSPKARSMRPARSPRAACRRTGSRSRPSLYSLAERESVGPTDRLTRVPQGFGGLSVTQRPGREPGLREQGSPATAGTRASRRKHGRPAAAGGSAKVHGGHPRAEDGACSGFRFWTRICSMCIMDSVGGVSASKAVFPEASRQAWTSRSSTTRLPSLWFGGRLAPSALRWART